MLLLFVAVLFFIIIAISRKRKENFLALIAEEKIKLQQAELNKKDALLRERERIIKDLHDELGGSLNSIRIISDLLLHQKPAPEKMLECIAKISSASKNISHQIKTVVWSLDYEKDSLYSLIEFIKHYANELLEYSTISLSVIEQHHAVDIPVSGLFRKNVFLVVKESLNNATKHSNATTLLLEMKLSENAFLLKIRDNGVGIKKINPFGNGLKNMSKRMEEIQGNFEITGEDGTSIQISVPLPVSSL